MDILHGGLKAPVIGDWVTIPDISGVGVDLVSSSTIYLPLPSDWWYQCVVQVEYTQQRTAGTGTCEAHARTDQAILHTTAGDDAVAGPTFFPRMPAADVAMTRRQSFTIINTHSSSASPSTDTILIRFRARGSAADTEFALTGMRARLVYIPL